MPRTSPIPGREKRAETSERKQHGVSGSALESVPPKTRRRFVASEKLRLLKAAAAAVASGEHGALEAMLRAEGIYSSHLHTWRQQFGAHGHAGLAPKKPGRKPQFDAKDRELLALNKRYAKLEKKLLIANAIIDLQKKAHETGDTKHPRRSTRKPPRGQLQRGRAHYSPDPLPPHSAKTCPSRDFHPSRTHPCAEPPSFP